MPSERAIVSAALEHFRYGGGWVRIRCPVCLDRTGKPDRRGALNFNTSTGGYICNKCQLTGFVQGYAPSPKDYHQFKAPAEPLREHHFEFPEIPLPPGFYPLWEGDGATSETGEAARAYARTRAPEDLWETLGLGATLIGAGVEANRIIIPVMDDVRRVIGWVGRSYLENSPRPYHYPHFPRREMLYNEQALYVATTTPCFIVEGCFDAIHLWPNAVAVLGKYGKRQLFKLANARRPVISLLDGDAVWDGESLEMQLRLLTCDEKVHPNFRVGRIDLAPGKDPDEYSPEALMQMAAF